VPVKKSIDLKRQVLDYIREKGILPGGEKLVVAVSGGPDSVCLLRVLADLRPELGIELHVAHLNHRLRGKDSDADATYVSKLARRLGLPATIESKDVKDYRKEKRIPLEEAAREVRYDFLAEVAKATGAGRVAVGHTADDHIETVLMHLFRGSGTRGLTGLRPLTRWKSAAGDLTIIRPLLELGRRDTLAYCRQHRLRPRTDVSNFSPEPFRNRVRLHLLPELRKYNPQIAGALLRTAAIAGDDQQYIDGEAEKLWKGIARQEKGAVIIDRKAFSTLPAALRRHLLRRAVESVRGSLKDIEAVHIEDILGALDGPAGKTIGLPFGLNFTTEYDRYVLAPDSLSLCPFTLLENETALNIPGRTGLPGWEVLADVITSPGAKALKGENDAFSAYLDFRRTGSRMSVRPRRSGDRFQPLGMGRAKKLNQFMIDARIPRSWRGRIPVVASPEQIIWVVGWRIDERLKVDADTKKVLHLEFKRT
jgi:tRNA(Ile)-lysidine synthase